jgi:hypothetical protein
MSTILVAAYKGAGVQVSKGMNKASVHCALAKYARKTGPERP